MNRGGLVITFLVLCMTCFFATGLIGALSPKTSGVAQIEASITSTIAASATSSPTWTSSPVPTVDTLATTSAQGEATSIAAKTAIATTQTAIAVSTDETLRAEALAALARERDDAHAIALAQIAELEAKKRLVELTLNPTAVSIRLTEDTRQLWRQMERERVEDEAHAQLVASQLEDAQRVSTSQMIGQVTLYAGLPIALVLSVLMLARAQSHRLKHERDRDLAQVEAANYQAELEHDLQMRRAEILNRNDLVNVVARSGRSQLDGRMTRERLIAFAKAAVLASGPASTVLTASNDPVWTSGDVKSSHREWTACADELVRLGWIEKPQRGKPTKLTDGATLGDLLSVLQGSNPESAPPVEEDLPLAA